MPKLSIALDAALALTRHAAPDLSALATLARLAGAHAIRVGVNEELAPLNEAMLRDLRRAGGALELCFSPVPTLIKVALEAQPKRVVLASAPRELGAPPGPLEFEAWGGALGAAVRNLREAGSAVSALVQPQPQRVKAAHGADFDGVELLAEPALELAAVEEEGLSGLADAAHLAAKLGLHLGIAGGLRYENVERVLEAAPLATHVCVGRAFLERSLLVGVDRAVRDLRALL